MASITAMKDPGFFLPFLAVVLLSLTLVSGETSPANSVTSMSTYMSSMAVTNATNITSPSSTSTASASSTAMVPAGTTNWTSTSWNFTPMSMISCPSFICNYSDCNAMYTSQNFSMCSGAYCQVIRLTDIFYNASCSDSCGNACVNALQTSCCVNCCNSTGCLNGTFASMISSTAMATTTTGTTNWTSTSWNFTPMSMISCPSFICNYSHCNAMYTSQNVSMCAGAYCQVIRLSGIYYNASCSDSCGNACVNASQTDCCVDCCNSTGCLNDTFASMTLSTTTTVTTSSPTTPPSSPTTTSLPTTPPSSPTTPPSSPTTPSATTNSNVPTNKCHTATCDDAKDCYKSFIVDAQIKPCATSEIHCELYRDTVNSKVKWTAGCTTSCSSETWCQSNSKHLSCHQECCNATKITSCLNLDGKLNVPNLAMGGPHFHIELIGFFICLLCFGSLM